MLSRFWSIVRLYGVHTMKFILVKLKPIRISYRSIEYNNDLIRYLAKLHALKTEELL